MQLNSNQKGKQMVKVTRKYTEKTGSTVVPLHESVSDPLEYYFLLSLPHLKNTEDLEQFLEKTREQ